MIFDRSTSLRRWFAVGPRRGLAVALTSLALAAAFGASVSALADEAKPAVTAPAPDPSGANTGGAADVAATANGQKLDEVAKELGHQKISINIVWTLLAAFLVMFMQAGFAMVEAGLTRAKNVSHTAAMNFLIYPLGMLGFYVCGFAFMFGSVGPVAALGGTPGLATPALTFTLFGKPFEVLGMGGFFLGPSVYDVGTFTLFIFQMVFMDTTATIPTGTLAERWKYSAFILYGIAVGTIMYPVYGMWVWGGGWLADLGVNFGLGHGHVDFAGSSVVHLTGGVIALVGGKMVGARYGKYNKDGSANVMPGHNIPMAVIGTFILAFGWFGFNAGSTLAGTDLRISVVAVNTMLASGTGALVATLWMWFVRAGKPDTSMMCNGMLAGLVAVTAPCAFVTSWAACLIGAVAGLLVVEAVYFVDRKLKIDDPVGAISVHGVNGIWGIIALGLFADGSYGDAWNGVPGTVKGLFYGDSSQLVAELIGIVANFAYIGPMSIALFWATNKLVGNRTSVEDEIEGLDIPEMGAPGYVGVALDKASETPIPF
jgi:Amt family ammonium transporter